MTITRTSNYSKKLNIRVGDLKHYITLQRRVLEVPINVDFRETYNNIANVWASVVTNNDYLKFNDININEEVTHIFYIRNIDGIDIDVWILYDNQRYKIISIRDIDFEKKFLELKCNLKGIVSKESSKW